MKFVQENISEPKSVEQSVLEQPKEPEQSQAPENKPESKLPEQKNSKKIGCLGLGYHVLIGLAVLGVIFSAYDQEKRIDELKAQNATLKNNQNLLDKKNAELEQKISENLEHLTEMYTWGKTVNQKNKELNEKVKVLENTNSTMMKKIQKLEQQLDENNKKKIRVKIGDQNYTISDMKLKIQEQRVKE